MAKQEEKKEYVFVRLKDRQSSAGQMVGNTIFNNATVECYQKGNVPVQVLAGIKSHIFEYCDEKHYDAWIQSQREAAENGKKIREARAAKKKQLVSFVNEDAMKPIVEAEKKEKTAKGKKAKTEETEDKGE